MRIIGDVAIDFSNCFLDEVTHTGKHASYESIVAQFECNTDILEKMLNQSRVFLYLASTLKIMKTSFR